ncbi:exported hypothetical protein [Rhodococcus sp. RD6.2]|nr:exported hypothetical protein [Rhodococcus sp. RD6.2]
MFSASSRLTTIPAAAGPAVNMSPPPPSCGVSGLCSDVISLLLRVLSGSGDAGPGITRRQSGPGVDAFVVTLMAALGAEICSISSPEALPSHQLLFGAVARPNVDAIPP